MLCQAPYALTNTLQCFESSFKLMCTDKTDSNKRMHPRKLGPKFKYQKLDKQKLTRKGCVSGEK